MYLLWRRRLSAQRNQAGFAFCILRFAFCIGQLLVHLPAHAAEVRGISVTGNGEVKARPNRLEIELQASGAAELTNDAVIKYDDALRRLTDAFDRLKNDNLTVEQGDLSFSSAFAGNVRAVNVAARNARAKPHTSIAQSLKLTLRNVDQLSQKELVATVGKLIDTAQDAGASIGGNPGGYAVNQINQFGQVIVQNQPGRPVVAFVIADFESLRDRAYQKAFEDAQTRAHKLAKLAHATLGEVISIDENQQMHYAAGGAFQQSLASIRLSEIPVRVSLRVRFELLEAPEKETAPSVQQ